MTVVRYTFDVCIKSNPSKDVYSMAYELEKSILNTANVCGCEATGNHTLMVNAVDVDKVIRVQNESGNIVGEERRK